MNPRLFLTLIYSCALIGITMGYLHQVWWLLVPPVVFGTYFFGSVARGDAYRRQYGGPPIVPSMIGANVMVTAWNSGIQTAIFFAAWGVSPFFSEGNG